MMMNFIRFFHTIRYIKLKQIAYRLYYQIRKPSLSQKKAPSMRASLSSWSAPNFINPATDDCETFTFLGVKSQINNHLTPVTYQKLWLYNLHYQDDLNAIGSDDRLELCQKLVDNWINDNSSPLGTGWEPYCISLRVVNWIKWLSRQKIKDIKPEWLDSLAKQINVLDQQIEYHIQANHLFANAKALVFAGVFFNGKQGERWLKKGLRLLDQEISEQFLSDGAHYELSPMYHAILLWDLADLINLERSIDLPQLTKRTPIWKKTLGIGLTWLQSMVHPDQDISFFNDATLGVSPNLNDLSSYVMHLDLKLPTVKEVEKINAKLFKESGYAVIDWPGAMDRLIADVAHIGPNYQPGHGHADTLSCELSLFGQRVLVNSGISLYDKTDERQRQRSTEAHNTVEVNDYNSSEVWAGFRVAQRARPFGVEMNIENQQVRLDARHDGYHRMFGKVTHQRQWIAASGQLSIIDELHGDYQSAKAYWHFHPNISVEQFESLGFKLILHSGQTVKLFITGAQVQKLDGTWHPGFGRTVSNKKLVLNLFSRILTTRLEWDSN